jgi:hypothetical protein
MFRLFPLVFILQCFCLYHAYKNKSSYIWYWLIFFIPVMGCLVYIIYHFYNRRNVEKLSEGFKVVVNSNYEVQKLEKELKFSDTISNRTLLAEKYYELQRFEESRELFNSCLTGFNKDNPYIIRRLVDVNYKLSDYDNSIYFGNQIKENNEFIKSEEIIFYAWSFYYINKPDLAEQLFESMDSKYSNYMHRLEYCKFLKIIGKQQDSVLKLEILIREFDYMGSYEKQFNKKNRKEAIRLINESRNTV